MLKTLELYKEDLENYSYLNLVTIAKYLDLNYNRTKEELINSISTKLVIGNKNSNLDLIDLPPEIILNIVKDLDIDDIINLCTRNKKLKWICDEPITWKYIYKRDLLNKNLENDNYKEAVLEIYYIKNNDEKFIKAAEKGYIILIENLYKNIENSFSIKNVSLINKAAKVAAKNSQIQILKFLYGSKFNKQILDGIYSQIENASKGCADMETLDFLYKKYVKYGHDGATDDYIIENFIKNKCFDQAKFIIKSIIENSNDLNPEIFDRVSTSNIDREFIKWLQDKTGYKIKTVKIKQKKQVNKKI